MTALATQRRRGRTRMAGCEPSGGSSRPDTQTAPTLFDEEGGEPTLEELVCGVWQGLIAHQQVACPLCGGELVPHYGAHAQPTEGRCGDCGTTLS